MNYIIIGCAPESERLGSPRNYCITIIIETVETGVPRTETNFSWRAKSGGEKVMWLNVLELCELSELSLPSSVICVMN